MNTQTTRKFLAVIFTLILMFVQSGCSGAQSSATETVIVNTSTPATTPTSADTPTPQATATSTSTPQPTATFTPNVTATQVPEITPPVEGKGNVVGLVLWNDQPVPQAAVWLCERFEGDCVGTYQYRANTDKNGYYVFKNVTPGKYLVAINSFSTGWFVFYFDSDGNREQKVTAGENLVLDPWNIWKFNLRVVSPRVGKTLSQEKPTFTWEAYPDAAYYQISIYDINYNSAVEGQRVDGIEFTPDKPLVTCRFYWEVEAYNAQGLKIASTNPGDLFFYDIDVPGKC